MTSFDALKTLLERDRSVRRFEQRQLVGYDTILRLVSLVRLCASGRNLQPLRYCVVETLEECESVFSTLKWAGYLNDWDGPEEGERPTAYLVQCLDTRLTEHLLCDDGLQLQTLTLGATALGLGCCIIKAFNSPELSKILALPEYLKPLYVLALGYPVEKVVLETTDGSLDADIRYWRDDKGVHHVPKRPFTELLVRRTEE